MEQHPVKKAEPKKRVSKPKHPKHPHAKALVGDLIGAGIAGGNKQHSAKYIKMLLEE